MEKNINQVKVIVGGAHVDGVFKLLYRNLKNKNIILSKNHSRMNSHFNDSNKTFLKKSIELEKRLRNELNKIIFDQ